MTRIDGIEVDDRQVAGTANMPRGLVGFRSNTNGGSNEQFTVHGVRVTRTDDGESLLDTDFTDGNPFTGGRLVGGTCVFTTSTETLLAAPDKPAPLMRKEFSVAGAGRATRPTTSPPAATPTSPSTASASATTCSRRASPTTTTPSSTSAPTSPTSSRRATTCSAWSSAAASTG